jgi:hypothetical protein
VGAMFATSGDGVRIAYEVHGTGPALLLLHGFSKNRRFWTKHKWIVHLQRIGRINGLLRRPPGRAPPSAPRWRSRLAHGSCVPPSAPRLLGWCWTCAAGWGRVAPQGCPGGKASGRALGKFTKPGTFIVGCT